MFIHLNLLAEAQAAEELRRRDPVKRALWLAGLLVSVMLVWSSSLQVKTMLVQRDLSRVENKIGSRTNEYQQVLDFQKKTADIEMKLGALHQLATNRFLNGTLLNALQQTTVENVQLLRLRADQSYLITEEVKAKKTESGRTFPARPATATEKIVLTLEAKDTAPNPGDQVNRFKEMIADHAYFQNALGKTNEVKLTTLSPPQSQPDGRAFVQFTLECRYPEKTR
ncbi:MAG: hypothetical protein MUF81_00990 [Verrucomicrobia bacterium]|nr:hypothetical protein [Verrucomicrobiota bacterium]